MQSSDAASFTDGKACESFFAAREELIKKEKQQRSDFEFRQSMSPVAQVASAIVARIRCEELESVWKNKENQELFPGMMFNAAKSHMEETRLWQIVRKMSKGALLHAHVGATVDLDWVLDTALTTPGVCISSSTPLDSVTARRNFVVRFTVNHAPDMTSASIWSSDYVPDSPIPLRNAALSFPDGSYGIISFVERMKEICSITQDESLRHHLGVDDIWKKLQTAFTILGPLVYYEPIMRKFLKQLFRELIEDSIRWVELRAVFVAPFLFEGQESPSTRRSLDLASLFVEEIELFRKEEPRFWGARFIWTAMRGWETTQILDDSQRGIRMYGLMVITDMRQCIEVKKRFPDLIAGYDVVGQENLGRTLHDLTPELIWFKNSCAAARVEIPFFFHAGECLGDGDETDNNLFNAILFGSRRIGHAFSLYKHPTLIDLVKEKKILVECCPISNEVLRYTASIMSHPLPALLARGVKAALSNDDPAVMGQNTSGLTHDFWQALQGWENLGLAGLGSLARNSIQWSAFENQSEKEWLSDIDHGVDGQGLKAKYMQQWASEWETFCEWVVTEFGEKA